MDKQAAIIFHDAAITQDSQVFFKKDAAKA
jgi:hypothetical protein